MFLLLENRGRVVDRDQIVARLWRDDSFLDTERSINTAIRKVRRALADNPHRPRYIETVIGKGYRFIAPVVVKHTTPSLEGKSAECSSDAEPRRPTATRYACVISPSKCRGRTPILYCNVFVGRVDLGRLPLLEVSLPVDVTLPLSPQDRMLIKLHGIMVELTAKATQALHAFTISALQSGLRTRASDHSPLPVAPGQTQSQRPGLKQ